jgi:PAS domain S-box-containing protein
VTAYWDKRCFELFGIPDERLSAEDFFHLLHPDDVEPVKNKVIHSFQTGSYEAEYRVLKGDRYVVISAKGKTTFDDKGNPIRLDGILLDITERKAKEESIKTLSLVASETTNGVLIQDSLGRITWANQGFTSITGYTHEEALGKEPWSFLSCPKTDQNLVEITYRKMKAGETFRSENVLLTKKGLEIWVSTTFNPILDENGELKQVVSIGVDITNQKEQETHQKNLLEELERKNEELRRDAKR